MGERKPYISWRCKLNKTEWGKKNSCKIYLNSKLLEFKWNEIKKWQWNIFFGSKIPYIWHICLFHTKTKPTFWSLYMRHGYGWLVHSSHLSQPWSWDLYRARNVGLVDLTWLTYRPPKKLFTYSMLNFMPMLRCKELIFTKTANYIH